MPDHLNDRRGRTIKVDCLCLGRNQRCTMCDGIGTLSKKACLRCGGMGKDGGAKCMDCKGHGYREIDNMNFID